MHRRKGQDRGSPRRPAGWVAAVAMGALLLMAPVAQAHQALPSGPGDQRAAYVDGTWPAGPSIRSGPTTLWYFESAFPGNNGQRSSYKDAVDRADLTWNGVGRTFNFAHAGYSELPTPIPYEQVRDARACDTNPQCGRAQYCDLRHDNPYTADYDPQPLSLVFWASLAPNVLGEATTCRVNDGSGNYRPQSFFVGVSKNFPWYRGTSVNTPDGKYDLQSVATHEFGHATGWVYHYDDPNQYLPQGGAVCDEDDPHRETMCSVTPPGSAWSRTLGPHDLHTFRAAYPQIQP